MFSSLVGNERIKSCLQKMSDDQSLTGTLLFKGPEGVGKGLFAIAVAKALFGKGHVEKIEKAIHPDVHLFYPEGKTGMHPITAMRDLIKEMALPPFEAPYKVFIIHDAERMLPTSSNALLKTLEEPVEKTLLILLTSKPDKLLPTIPSRARCFAFFPVSEKEIRLFLEERLQKAPQEARQIAFLAQGSLAKALFLAQKSSDPARALLVDVLSTRYDYPSLCKALALLEEGGQKEEGAPPINEAPALFEQILFWYRDRHLLALGGSLELLFYQDHLLALQKAEQLPLPSLRKLLLLIQKCTEASERNIRLRHCLEYFFLNTL
jgi:DNA polymerase III subunit delta'